MDVEDINQSVLEETDYMELLMENGFQGYTEDELEEAVMSVQEFREIEMMRQFRDEDSLTDAWYNGMGESLDRLDESGMLERPSTGNTYVKLTEISNTYLDSIDRFELYDS